MKSVCLIIPYFGKFPSYFDCFICSCKYNPTINWLIITDNIIENKPDNIIVKNMEFSDFCNKIQTKFDFKISIDSPYKLCDFKPAYGYILEEEIKGYDYWGYCDMDLIFGNIRKFISEDIFIKYSKILTCGHLSLYKNDYSVNRWFMSLSPIAPKYSYINVFSSPLSFAFDEFGGKKSWGGMVKMMKNAGIKIFDKMDFDDIRQTQYSFYSRRPIKNKDYSLAEISKMPSYYSFNEGELTRHIKTDDGVISEESLYVHFQKRNMTVASNLDVNHFVIIPNKFVRFDTEKNELWKLSSYRTFYPPYYIRRFNNLKKKVKYILFKK